MLLMNLHYQKFKLSFLLETVFRPQVAQTFCFSHVEERNLFFCNFPKHIAI